MLVIHSYTCRGLHPPRMMGFRWPLEIFLHLVQKKIILERTWSHKVAFSLIYMSVFGVWFSVWIWLGQIFWKGSYILLYVYVLYSLITFVGLSSYIPLYLLISWYPVIFLIEMRSLLGFEGMWRCVIVWDDGLVLFRENLL